MPARSKVEMLPDEIRTELEGRLVSSSFSGYRELQDWLAERGHHISKTALNNFGQSFEERCTALRLATRKAEAIVQSMPDRAGSMNDALIRLIQERALTLMEEADDPSILERLPALGKMVADITRASIMQKRWMEELHEKAVAAATAVEKEIKRAGGLSSDAVQAIRKQILGIAS
jgi:hypothetical protein